jgi:hypothetical protein
LVQNFFAKSCRTSMTFLNISAVTVILDFRVQINSYPQFSNFWADLGERRYRFPSIVVEKVRISRKSPL